MNRSMDPSGPFAELDRATIADVGADLRARTLSIRELTEMYLERIEALDRDGPPHTRID